MGKHALSTCMCMCRNSHNKKSTIQHSKSQTTRDTHSVMVVVCYLPCWIWDVQGLSCLIQPRDRKQHAAPFGCPALEVCPLPTPTLAPGSYNIKRNVYEMWCSEFCPLHCWFASSTFMWNNTPVLKFCPDADLCTEPALSDWGLGPNKIGHNKHEVISRVI